MHNLPDKQTAIEALFARYTDQALVVEWQNQWRRSADDAASSNRLYAAATAFLEETMWRSDCADADLKLYQQLFREWEARSRASADERFDFLVVIPVADRPRHLRSCLESLLELCRSFHYGGLTDGRYRKVEVLVADDSREADNIAQNRTILQAVARQGLDTLYFGQTEQLQLLERLGPDRQDALRRIIGEHAPDNFHHKGASITRNITLLKLAEMAEENPRRLFWLLDSDQEFRVNTADRNVTTINYFHQLERIFRATDALVLTGKVVGDPPVSPAVMAGNFLEDVLNFLSAMAGLAPREACRFHGRTTRQADDAAYHDMANLFGFKTADNAFDYRCGLEPPHDHRACFADFAARLNRFFDGEHPTRRTEYEHQEPLASVKPARTVYTGNYVFRAAALAYFIPFAALKLRMAGPVLGRILRAEQGEAFVSANLPMLHKRTVEQLGQSEFRPDIERNAEMIDLSGEYERQYFGDVMLFSIERITAQGYPGQALTRSEIHQALQQVEASMREKYTALHEQILAKLERLQALFDDPGNWWQADTACRDAKDAIQRFIDNMQHNFGSHAAGYRMLQDPAHRTRRLDELCEAILQLPRERSDWREVLAELAPGLLNETP